MESLETAVFAGGCFWCTEAIFKRLKGVKKVEPGYSGGDTKNPPYEEVSTGLTNHAEVVKVTFNPKIISYKKLVKIFFHTHNPTTINQQGADIGTQYRSAIFYTDRKQKEAALREKGEFNKNNAYGKNATTSIEKLSEFYKAENYHQNYYDKNKNYPYCTVVIDPKVRKLIKEYKNEVKEEFKN